MGYHTEFRGTFTLNKKLTKAHADYLKEFAGTRRMKRDVTKMEGYTDPLRLKAKLPLGTQGGFYVGEGDNNPKRHKNLDSWGDCAGQTRTTDIVDYNSPPSTQPGLWCQWVPTEEGKGIEWDGGEKFYAYVEWLRYLIANFLKPWGYKLNGMVEWEGEQQGDLGKIVVKNNEVTLRQGRVVFEGFDE